MNKKLRIVFLVLTVAVMILIFLFSTQNSADSSKQSGTVTEFIVKIFIPDFESLLLSQKEALILKYQGIIRTLAHATIFAALGFCAGGFSNTLSIKKRTAILFTALFCVLYALSDEIHQIFSPGRAFQIIDILVDTAGSLFGIGAIMIIMKRKDMNYEKHF